MTACQLDGSVRVIIAREENAVMWHCPWCRQITREEFIEEE